MPSQYYPALPQCYHTKAEELILEGEEFHHLARVLHHKPGDVVKLNSGSGLLALAEITAISKNSARMQILEYRQAKPFPAPFAIAFSLLKNRRDEEIVEKCTELGATRFFPFTADYTVRKPVENTLLRFRNIALAAIKQCDNPVLPIMHPVADLRDTLQVIRAEALTPVLCSERRPDVWINDLASGQLCGPCFIIGPEGGFSREEFAFFTAEALVELSLGYLITRADTAAVSIAAQWLAYANREITGGTR